jgi:hypothetical protein
MSRTYGHRARNYPLFHHLLLPNQKPPFPKLTHPPQIDFNPLLFACLIDHPPQIDFNPLLFACLIDHPPQIDFNPLLFACLIDHPLLDSSPSTPPPKPGALQPSQHRLLKWRSP